MSGQDGFTFNEVLVAMSIIVVSVLGYSLSTLVVVRGNATSDHYSAAMNLAHDKIEELKAAAQITNEDRCPEGGEHNLSGMGNLGGIFNRCWKISDWLLGTRLKQVDVTVTWRDYENREVKLSTLIYTGS